jgi:alpha-glucosidase
VRITNSKIVAADETYQLVVGKASTVRAHYNMLQLDLQENSTPGRKLVIEARAYNDAVAFRYISSSMIFCFFHTQKKEIETSFNFL